MSYLAKQGDIILLNFNPQSGHEQAGVRPALVVSNEVYNNLTKMVLVCPITSHNKAYPLHVEVQANVTKGVVMCDQVKALDISSRGCRFLERASDEMVEEVLFLLKSCLDLDVNNKE